MSKAVVVGAMPDSYGSSLAGLGRRLWITRAMKMVASGRAAASRANTRMGA